MWGYYEGIENAELYLRYIQFGVFNPIFILASEGGKYYKRDVKPTYIQIPILLKMRTDTFGGIFRAFGEIGYGFNVLVKKNDKGDENVWQVYEHKNKYRDVCSSFIVHLGMEMSVMDRSTLQVMLAYDNDFSSMMPIGYDKFTWNNFCLEVGFLF